MIEKWHEIVDKGGAFGLLLTDISKAFDCVPNELLIAKLHTSGFNMKSLNLVYDYLYNRKCRVKLGGAYSSWREILYGVPLGLILGPLLFNIFLFVSSYFHEGTDIAS